MATRQPFSAQAVLYVLLDYRDEARRGDVQVIYKALENTVVVGGGVVGGVRLPGLGVGALGSPFTRLLRLTPIRGHLPSLISALPRMLEDLTPADRSTEINQEVGEALDAVIAEAASFPPASQHSLQMVVVTWGPVAVLTEALSQVLTLEHARYLSAVHVAGVESLEEGALGGAEGGRPRGDAVGGVWVTGATYPPDPYTFAALFKSWLLESKGKEPHLHLIFPPSSTSTSSTSTTTTTTTSDSSTEPLTLLLDMQEVMVEPASLPSAIASRLTIHANLYRTVCTTQGSTVAVPQVQVVKRVQVGSVAPAVFGAAHHLLPSAAAALSFNTIWDNRQLVASLCHQLEEADEGLLARVEAPPGALSPIVVVLPAPHCSALSLVHVAPSELMLAERHCPAPPHPIPDKLAQAISSSLASLTLSDLRLEDHTSPLVHALAAHYTHHGRPHARGGTNQQQQQQQQQHTTAPHHHQPPSTFTSTGYVYTLPRPSPPRHPAHLPPSRGRGGRGGRRATRAHLSRGGVFGNPISGGAGEGGGLKRGRGEGVEWGSSMGGKRGEREEGLREARGKGGGYEGRDLTGREGEEEGHIEGRSIRGERKGR
ncbi:meiosis 1 arrest protein-like [Eriocheir sinensis]|uniref:meiosis 1 arrest protein-like n=1 Tax=Eriocheir sinensis TaxID=95602 RepID=UPI0021C68159|nr:meiosis 1 arrest protein-like [Eriocheir sinensis]